MDPPRAASLLAARTRQRSDGWSLAARRGCTRAVSRRRAGHRDRRVVSPAGRTRTTAGPRDPSRPPRMAARPPARRPQHTGTAGPRKAHAAYAGTTNLATVSGRGRAAVPCGFRRHPRAQRRSPTRTCQLHLRPRRLASRRLPAPESHCDPRGAAAAHRNDDLIGEATSKPIPTLTSRGDSLPPPPTGCTEYSLSSVIYEGRQTALALSLSSALSSVRSTHSLVSFPRTRSRLVVY